MKVKKAIIPAAGLGTRLLPATKAQPKEMLPVVDKPTIQYIIEEAVDAGIEEILIITGKGKRAIEDHFDSDIKLEMALEQKGKDKMLEQVKCISNLVDIHYVRQKQPKGLGHAIYCARTFVGNDPFAVLLGDDIMVAKKPVIAQMIDIFEERKNPVIGVQKVPEKDVSKYGILKYSDVEDRAYTVQDMIEKPEIDEAPSNLAILGRYIITPDIFPILENTEPGRKGEIQLTDALKELLNKRPIIGYDFAGERYDVGNKFGYLKATVEFALKRDDLGQEFKEYLNGLCCSE
ncbi:MAG: UTP--glucose-1-phosphate uridylyltransferase GalU [Halothermotrichaceae bacterium]